MTARARRRARSCGGIPGPSGWSTSSSSVLSDWTISGPSVTGWPPTCGGHGRRRRSPGTSSGPSSSAATGSATCRRTPGRTCRPSRRPSLVGPKSTTRVAMPITHSAVISAATLEPRSATCRCQLCWSWPAMYGVTGCLASSVFTSATTSSTSPLSDDSKIGRSSRRSRRNGARSRSSSRRSSH